MAVVHRLDLVVFGATGFTGTWAVKEVEKLALEKTLTWGIAGRNESKLKDVLAKVGKNIGKDISRTKIIVADVKDEKSLIAMAKQSAVIVNCCGPYRHYGEPVVKACVAAGASCVDISGEPEYIEKMQLEYNEEAEKKGVYIISACGAVDSIPADLGAAYLQQNFTGDINSIEAFVKSRVDGSHKGADIHFGTYESAVYAAGNMNAMGPLRKKLYPTPLPKLQPKLSKGAFFWDRISRGWCLPFPGTDQSVMERTQRFVYDNDKNRPAQIAYYISFTSLLQAIGITFVIISFGLLSKFECGRRLLLKHPRFFSAGYVSHKGPSEEKMKNTHFEVYLVGRGWKDKKEEPVGRHETGPDQKITVKVSCTDPVYGATCTTLVLAGITILKESHKMPRSGGVLPPGAAFKNTSLVKELNNHGVKFEILHQDTSAREEAQVIKYFKQQ